MAPVGEIQVSELTLQRLADGIRIPTISTQVYEETNFAPFDSFKVYLSEAYPAIYEVMDPLTVNTYGLVFHWKGKNSSLNPILFLSHYDVVPVVGYDPENDNAGEKIFQPGNRVSAPVTEVSEKWDYLPFSGAVTEGRVYGRGTLDMKGMLFSLLEAADELIGQGFQPERDIWFAFGHDEEVGGLHGAVYIANYFKEQGLTFDAVYDEGGTITRLELSGKEDETPVALVGVGEKGFLSVRIKVSGLGGHSSMPPVKSSLVYAAEIIEKLNSNQMPGRIIPPIATFLEQVGGDLGFTSRMAIANQWLFKPLLLSSFRKNPATNALIRTTTAITMAKGSDASNVIASVAEVTVNFRVLPGDTVEDVLNHVREICEGYEVELQVLNSREPSAISPQDTRGFKVIQEALNQTYPEAVATAYITIGGTDAYKYQLVSDHIYRLMPIYLNTYEQRMLHNENEHISIENYGKMIRYFRTIMQNY